MTLIKAINQIKPYKFLIEGEEVNNYLLEHYFGMCDTVIVYSKEKTYDEVDGEEVVKDSTVVDHILVDTQLVKSPLHIDVIYF